MSILIVEDNRVNARLLALILNAQGYQTVVAIDGKEGLRIVAETPDIELIITDFMMPEMDGVEFIAKVRAMPAFRSVPILVASAHGDLETVKRVRSPNPVSSAACQTQNHAKTGYRAEGISGFTYCVCRSIDLDHPGYSVGTRRVGRGDI